MVNVGVEVERKAQDGDTTGVVSGDGTPVTRQITDTDVDQVRITVGTPSLFFAKPDGDVEGAKIQYKIEIRYSGGSFTQVGEEHTISGISRGLYQEKQLIVFDPNGAFPIDIRVTRTHARYVRPEGRTLQDDFIWYDYTEKVLEKTRFPNSAVTGFKIDAKQFPNVPTRSYRIRGIKVRIPHNATVRSDGSLEYDSSTPFNGTFKAAREWTNDPAWILFDLLTNTRYGMGSQILTPEELEEDKAGNFEGASDVPSNLDVYSFQQASAYCGEQVTVSEGALSSICLQRASADTGRRLQVNSGNVLCIQGNAFLGSWWHHCCPGCA